MKEPGSCQAQNYGTPTQQAHRVVWDDDRWATRRIWQDWAVDRWSTFRKWLETKTGWKARSLRYGGTYWPKGFPKPRTCSYCGGVHPIDAIELVTMGWESEGTTKGYKRYLHPPGYRIAIRGFDLTGTFRGPRSPVPPVKVYGYHFDQRQVDAFNAAIDAQTDKQKAG